MSTATTPTPPDAGTPAPVPTSAPAPAASPAASAGASVVGDALVDGAKAGETSTPAEAGKQEEQPKSAPAAIELKLPEGFDADKAALEGFKATASELGLDTAKAQKLFDQYVAIEKARGEAAEKAFAEQDAKWAAAVQADPDIGGEKLKTTVTEVRAALNWLGPGVGQLIKAAGLGNNPDVVKAFVKLGRGLADDSIKGTSTPGAGQPPKKSDAEIF